MGFDDLLGVGRRGESVPDALGVDHDGRAVLALVQAAGRVDPDSALQAAAGHGSLDRLADRFAAPPRAAAPGVPLRPNIGTHENVFLKARHVCLS
jgi:hypothetical protein